MILALYGLLTKDYTYQDFMMLSLGLMFLMMSIQEFREKRKAYGWVLLATSLFTLIVVVQSFLLS